MEFRALTSLPRYSRSSASIRAMLLTCLVILQIGCSRSSHPVSESQAGETANAKPQIQAPRLELPDCDPSLNKVDVSRGTGHHRVALAWNPSSSSGGPADPSVGYCLYRSTNDITARDLSHCKDCARLNRRPIVGTACMDTRVQDGATYHYVVGAIQVGTRVSPFSNRTTAVVPANTQIKRSESSYPLCQPDEPSQVPAAANPNP